MPRLARAELARRLRAVRLVLMDVDGVLTDGRIFHFVDTGGALVEFKGIHSHDSIALSWLSKAGLTTGAISGRDSRGTGERLKMLGCRFILQGRLDKDRAFAEVCRDAPARPEEALYIGDDLPDLPVLRAAGVAVAPPDGRPEARAAAHWVTKAPGGRGAVREVAEALLRAQGRWEGILGGFLDSGRSVG